MGRRSGLLSIFSQIQDFKRVLPQCGVVALVVAARVIREWGITVDKVMDLIEKNSVRRGVTIKTVDDLKVCTMRNKTLFLVFSFLVW